jgi:hypothetical protein
LSNQLIETSLRNGAITLIVDITSMARDQMDFLVGTGASQKVEEDWAAADPLARKRDR